MFTIWVVAVIPMFCKSMDWFLYDRNLRHETVNVWQQQVSYEA